MGMIKSYVVTYWEEEPGRWIVDLVGLDAAGSAQSNKEIDVLDDESDARQSALDEAKERETRAFFCDSTGVRHPV